MTYDEIVNAVMADAGKSGDVNKKAASTQLDGVISYLNSLMQPEIMRAITAPISVTAANNAIVDLPPDVGTIYSVGQWDATTARILQPYKELLVGDFEARYANIQTIAAQSGSFRFWMLLERKAENQKQIRIFPPPDVALSIAVRHFAVLTKQNIDTLENTDLLLTGVKARMPGWFEKSYATLRAIFEDEVNNAMADRGAIGLPITIRDRPETEAANRMNAWLTGGR